MKSLQKIWDDLAAVGYKTDKGDLHSYLPVYEEILAPYRETAINVLEIGIFHGHSMRLWEQYFTKARVHGIDCSETPIDGMADLRPMIAEGTHHIHILDATDPIAIQKEFRGMDFQVIIDDGNHNILSQLLSYKILSKFLSDNGLYVIEDIENIDQTKTLFEELDPTKTIEILDRRHIKNRYDDVLVIIKDKP